MVPSDKILENQYTKGNEFVDSTGKYYQGYYCVVLGSKYYTGKTYTVQSKELSKVTIVPKSTEPKSLPPQNGPIRYFLKKLNVFPASIKEVNEETFTTFKNNPLYQSAMIKMLNINNRVYTVIIDDESLNQAEAQMPGLKTFLSV